jgi:hypothetical protein
MRQQIGDFTPQPGIAATDVAQIRVALAWIALQRLVKDLFNLFPAFQNQISGYLSTSLRLRLADPFCLALGSRPA